MPRIQAAEKPFTFRERSKLRFLGEIKRVRDRYELENMVLVLTASTALIISNLFSISELIDLGITFIERLEVVRKPLNYHAFYFVEPSHNVVERIIADYDTESKALYCKVHILFSGSLERKLLRMIASCNVLMKRLARHSIRETNFSLRLLSDDSLSMNLPYLSYAYSDSPEEEAVRIPIARNFAQIVSNFDRISTVRFYYEHNPNKVAQRMASAAAARVKKYLETLLDNKCASLDKSVADISFYIADRSLDPLTPLIHSLTYESMLLDLDRVTIEGDSQKVVQETKKAKNTGRNHQEQDKRSKETEMPSTDKFETQRRQQETEPIKYSILQDEIYEQIRYEHMSYVLSLLPQRLQQVTSNMKTIKDVAELRRLTAQAKMLEKHIPLVRALMEEFTRRQMLDLVELEQCLATGVDNQGRQTSSGVLFRTVVEMISNTGRLTPLEKIRLALLTLCCIRLNKSDYLQLIALFSEDDQKVLRNIVALGVTYDGSISRSTKAFDKSHQKRAKERINVKGMAVDRYTNAIEIVLPRFISFVKSKEHRERDKNVKQETAIGHISVSVMGEAEAEQFDENRFICFMCGGLSLAEMCSLKKEPSLRGIVLATDDVLTPKRYIDQLRSINLGQKSK